ncbi:MAG: kdpA [Myxococcales bacterium]|nr:kdpA [Myxococcales bacterium]
MTPHATGQLVIYCVVLIALAIPLGAYMARVYQGEATWAQRVLGPLERLIYRACRVRASEDMPWTRYALAVMWFSLASVILVYAMQRLQAELPLDPAGLPNVPPNIAFNTAVSFTTNTNWQAYGGETTLSHLTQMSALAVQNFVSAGVGMAVLVALIRGFTRKHADGIGNFWVDLTRSTLYILLPLSLVYAVFLVGTGIPQTFDPTAQVHTLQHGTQHLSLGPVASQVAIKMLGTNGGGYYNANGAHPFENPTILSNVTQMLAILLIAAALCLTFGRMVKARRQGAAILAAMFLIFVPVTIVTTWAEQRGNPTLVEVDQAPSHTQGGGNMEGKEVRNGAAASALWATATTSASNGSVNAMHDSFTPLGGLGPMWLIQLGEVVFGGVGSGLYGMLLFAIVAVFLAGLMVGRTPEFLGKKIEAFEMKMATLGILAPSVCILIGTAIAVSAHAGTSTVANPGPHGFSEILYAFSSASGNNGSAFGGLTVNTDFYTAALAVCMWLGRFVPLIAVLAVAGSLAKKKTVPPSSGTLPTDGPLFVVLLVGVVILVGALTFLPALGLGPIVEHLQL